METEGLISGAIYYFICQVTIVCFHHESIVVLIGRFLADNMLLRNQNAQSYGLTAPFHGIRRGVVGTPAGTQSLLVGKLLRPLHVDDAGRKLSTFHVAVEEHIHIGITMTCILRVADGHVDG